MFRIMTDQATEDGERLRRCVFLFTRENAEIEAISRELGTISGMEDVLLHLYHVHNRMQEEDMVLRQMTQGLSRAVQCYRDCENRICANAEQSAVRHVHREVGMNDFSHISDLVEKILLSREGTKR